MLLCSDLLWIQGENSFESNYMTLTEKQLDPNLSKFEIETTGEGCAMVHLVEKYNVMPELAQPETGLRVNVFVRAKSRQCTIREQRKLTVCANYKSRRQKAYKLYDIIWDVLYGLYYISVFNNIVLNKFFSLNSFNLETKSRF